MLDEVKSGYDGLVHVRSG